MAFKDRQLNPMPFQTLKMKCLNSMTFQVFHDPYKSFVLLFAVLVAVAVVVA